MEGRTEKQKETGFSLASLRCLVNPHLKLVVLEFLFHKSRQALCLSQVDLYPLILAMNIY